MMRLNKFALIVTVIVFFGTVTTASAQWYLGPRAGLNLMSMSTNQAGVETSSLIGIHGGLTLRKQLSKQINVQMDVLYSQMGGSAMTTVDVPPLFMEIEQNNYFNYVQTPIYANIEFPIKPKRLVPYFDKPSWSSFHLYGGGYFGYALSAEQEVTTTTYSDGEITSKVVTPRAEVPDSSYNAIDYGIIVGAGFSFKLDEDDKQRLGVDFRYMYGLGNTSTVKGVTATNSALQVSLFYTFKLTNRKHIRYAR